MTDRNTSADWRPDKGAIKNAPVFFIISIALVVIGLLLTSFYTKHYQHPVTQWIVFVVLSIALLGFTNYFVEREAYAKVDGSGKPAIQIWAIILAWFFYAFVVWGTGTASRTNRVENCTPKTQLITSSGQIPNPDAYINFWSDCKGNDKILLDAPFQDYIHKVKRLPSWVMTPNGITSDVSGWISYYRTHPLNPYPIDSMTPEEMQQFYNTRQLPDRILHPDK